MDIIYLGHSSFKIKSKTASVVTDPFDPKMVGLKFSPVEADIVTVSHNHDDHNQSRLVKNARKIIDGPGEYEIQGISIIGFSCFHDNKKGEESGTNIIFVYEVDGLRIAHLGDLGHNLSQELIEDLGDIDILMIPVGGVFLKLPTVLEIIQSIEPSIVIPMHFKVEGMNVEVFSKFEPVESFLKEVSLPVEKLPKLSLKKEELGEDQKVVVLEKK